MPELVSDAGDSSSVGSDDDEGPPPPAPGPAARAGQAGKPGSGLATGVGCFC